MKDFVAIDFETANPQRVSACAFGYARVRSGEIVEKSSWLVKPIGGHAEFQSKIHGIKEEHTHDKPTFADIYPACRAVFDEPVVAHSQFDKQVLGALSSHFKLGITFRYTDSSMLAKTVLPELKNSKLATLAKHFNLPDFRHHDAGEDAATCASVFVRLVALGPAHVESCGDSPTSVAIPGDPFSEFKVMIESIVSDSAVDYKEAHELYYWLQDHEQVREKYGTLFNRLETAIEDGLLDKEEASGVRKQLGDILRRWRRA